MKNGWLMVMALCLQAVSAAGAINEWAPGAAGLWSETSNWSLGVEPTSSDTVRIGAASLVTNTSATFANDVRVGYSSGAQPSVLTFTSGADLTASGGLQLAETSADTAEVNMTGGEAWFDGRVVDGPVGCSAALHVSGGWLEVRGIVLDGGGKVTVSGGELHIFGTNNNQLQLSNGSALEIRGDGILAWHWGNKVATLAGLIDADVITWSDPGTTMRYPGWDQSWTNAHDEILYAYNDGGRVYAWTATPEAIEHVIITSAEIAAATTDYTVADLRDHRMARGMRSTIVTVEDITAHYPGRDDAEKVRNFIKFAHANWGTKYVLLAGDTGQVPHRIMYKNNFDNVQIASDLYFGCLDGSFDADGDGRFGEGPVDNCDYEYEVAVGRISGENADEISHGVYKTIMAENTPRNASFLTKMMNVDQDAAGVGDTFAWADKFTSRHRELSMEFYHDKEFNKNDFLTRRLNNHHVGQYAWASHGQPNKLGDEFWNATANGLTGANQFFFIHTLACLAGRFQEDCMAERLTTQNRNGGAFAVLFNSVNAFAGPDSMPPWVHTYFPETYYEKGITRLGDIRVDMGKNQDPAGNVNSRYTAYHHNLFGDPAAVWKQLYAVSLANHWPLDAGAGGVCEDRSGNGNPLALAGDAAWVEDGKFGPAVQFYGAGVVSGMLNNWAPLSNFGEITLSCWVRPDAFGGDLVKKGDAASSVFRLTLAENGKLLFAANDGLPANQRGGEQNWTSSGALTPDTWNHVAVMYDKDAFSPGITHGDAGKLNIYINGVLDSSHAVSMLYFGENAAPLVVGSGFRGVIDDVRVYGRPLSSTELAVAMDNNRVLHYTGIGAAEIPHVDKLAIERRLTLAAWVKADVFEDDAVIVRKGSISVPFGLMLTDDGALRFKANQGAMAYASNAGIFESGTALKAGEWNHAAVTYDGEMVRFYINGEPAGTAPALLRFGRNSESLHISEVSAEVKVYDRPLSGEEIKRQCWLADSDGDGIVNLREYALGGDPLEALDRGFVPTFQSGDGALGFVHALRHEDQTLNYTLETCSCLASNDWKPVMFGSTTNVTGGSFDFVTNAVPADDPVGYLRLVIEKQ